MDILINRKLEQVAELRSLLERVSKPLNPVKVQTSISVNGYTDTMVKILDLERGIDADIDRYVDEKAEMMKVIDSLEDSRHIDLLYRRYFRSQTWEQIAVDMNYTWRHMHRLHSEALIALEKKMSLNVIECHY